MEMVRPAAFQHRARNKDLLRFMTCGSVDDGKSTLIGRLLHDTRLIFDDQFAALVRDSGRHGTTDGDIDFALLLDGLEAEREQGITIDVAYRFFATPQRAFVVADAPGHEQFTRNMVTAASNTELAVILIDARKGVLVQTRRHSFICALLGIRHIIVAVNKIDLVDFRESAFDRIVDDYLTFASELGFSSIVPIPISARFGDNIADLSAKTPWYRDRPLLEHLETVDVLSETSDAPFRFPVQLVNRPNQDFRGYAGTVASGQIRKGDPIVVASTGLSSRIEEIVTYDGPMEVGRAWRGRDADSQGRDRYRPWRRPHCARFEAGGLRAVCRQHTVDGSGVAVSRPGVRHTDWDEDRFGKRHGHQV